MKFKPGTSYSCRSLTDHNCIWTFSISARTEKTVTLVDDTGFVMGRRAVKVDEDGDEYLLPIGSYSMAPVLRATKPKGTK